MLPKLIAADGTEHEVIDRALYQADNGHSVCGTWHTLADLAAVKHFGVGSAVQVRFPDGETMHRRTVWRRDGGRVLVNYIATPLIEAWVQSRRGFPLGVKRG